MKRLIIFYFIIFSSLPNVLSCQTYFASFTGFNISKMDEIGDVNDFFEIYEKGYSIESLVYGIKINQLISDKTSLSIRGAYSQKKVPAFVADFFPLKGFIYRQYRTSLTINWHLKQNWRIGIGPSLSYLKGIVKNDWSSSVPFYTERKKGFSFLFFTGYNFKNIQFELKYLRGLSMSSIERATNLLKPIHSFELTIGYNINLTKSKEN